MPILPSLTGSEYRVPTNIMWHQNRTAIYKSICMLCKCAFVKRCKTFSLQVWTGPERSRRLRLQKSLENLHEYRYNINSSHRPPLPPGHIPGTHFFWRLSRTQGHSATGGIQSRNKPNDPIKSPKRDLPACSPNELRHSVPGTTSLGSGGVLHPPAFGWCRAVLCCTMWDHVFARLDVFDGVYIPLYGQSLYWWPCSLQL
jgi:hypothetical protein